MTGMFRYILAENSDLLMRYNVSHLCKVFRHITIRYANAYW